LSQLLVLVLVVFRFIRDRVVGAADSEESLSPDISSAPPGGAQGVPRPAERHSPSSVTWASSRCWGFWGFRLDPNRSCWGQPLTVAQHDMVEALKQGAKTQ
ncbi:hypothetical protein ATANTOWER_027780, partial [Ataeniobius toweri]|nr:hypothetical protein [Ataeniobius toweri]